MGVQARLLRCVDEIADVVRADAGEAERTGRLGEATLQALCDTGLLRMLVPAEVGGGGLHVHETFPIVHALARVNGSMAWNVHIGATTAATAAELPTEAREEVFGDPRSIVAGTLQFFNIRAERVDGGYTLTGTATFLSGSAHASWLALGGWLHVDGVPQSTAAGMPRIIRGVVPRGSVEIDDTWHVSGLRATSSHDAELPGVFVPDAFVCSDDGFGVLPDDPVRRLPMFLRFGAGIAWLGLGIARGALDACTEVAARKVPAGGSRPLRERTEVQIAVARAHGLVESGAAFLDARWRQAAATLQRGEDMTAEEQAMLRLAYVTAASNATSATDLVAHIAGTSGLYEREGIERCWRDVHAVDKHITVSSRHLERVGRILLGLPPAPGAI